MGLHFIAIIALLLAGMVLGISFLESWAKFRTPSLSKPVGLDVGRTIFSIFHRVQNAILIIIIGLGLAVHLSIFNWALIIGIALILSIQSFWLLPQLNARVDIIMSGRQPATSPIHAVYGMLEVIKLTLLISLGVVAGIFSQ